MKTIKIIIILSIVLAFSSCREKMDVNLTGTYTRLIVNGKITTDSVVQSVKLTKTADYFDNKPVVAVTNASVTVNDGTTTYNLIEKVPGSGVYETIEPLKGIPGKTYLLSIHNANVGNGVTDYQASSYLPDYSAIDSITIMKITKNDFAPPRSQFALKCYISDPVNFQNNYAFQLSRNGKDLTDTLTKMSFVNDEYANGKKTWTLPFFLRYDFEGAGSAGDYSSINVIDSVKKGDVFVMQIDGITKDYLNFLTEMLVQSQGSSPFSGPPANVSTNVYPKENAVGSFTAYSIIRDTIIIK